MNKILWHSNAPHVATGYGSQTALFTPRIRDLGYDVAISGFYGIHSQVTEWRGMKVYPMGDDFGTQWVPIYAAHHADSDNPHEPRDVLVLTLMDVFALRSPAVWKKMRVASWVPIDHVPAPPIVTDFFEASHAMPIAMSRFGEQQLQFKGFDPLYVPHGIDTSLLVPRDDPREPLRAKESSSLPDDVFVVGMVAANMGTAPARKAFPEAFVAFAELHRRHPDTMLYLHTKMDGGTQGLDLAVLADRCGVPLDAIRFTPELGMQLGFPYEEMSWIYSSFDVLMVPSYGEGFGIPIVEAQACGTPVIVNDFSAMPELCGAGWKIGGHPWYDASQGAWFQAPSIPELTDALEAAYQAKQSGEGERLSVEAREFALGYDVEKVTVEFWKPTLIEIERRFHEQAVRELAATGSMPPVRLNRSQRRAKSKR